MEVLIRWSCESKALVGSRGLYSVEFSPSVVVQRLNVIFLSILSLTI